jgi:hypothetical protein
MPPLLPWPNLWKNDIDTALVKVEKILNRNYLNGWL